MLGDTKWVHFHRNAAGAHIGLGPAAEASKARARPCVVRDERAKPGGGSLAAGPGEAGSKRMMLEVTLGARLALTVRVQADSRPIPCHFYRPASPPQLGSPPPMPLHAALTASGWVVYRPEMWG